MKFVTRRPEKITYRRRGIKRNDRLKNRSRPFSKKEGEIHWKHFLNGVEYFINKRMVDEND